MASYLSPTHVAAGGWSLIAARPVVEGVVFDLASHCQRASMPMLAATRPASRGRRRGGQISRRHAVAGPLNGLLLAIEVGVDTHPPPTCIHRTCSLCSARLPYNHLRQTSLETSA
jgi:hypothetical protein